MTAGDAFTARGPVTDGMRRDRIARIIGGVVKEALRSTGSRSRKANSRSRWV